MKLEEAKTKVCPFIIDVTMQEPSSACGCTNIPRNINCVASECMAWCFTKVYSGTPNLYGIYPKEEVSAVEGYCVRLAK